MISLPTNPAGRDGGAARSAGDTGAVVIAATCTGGEVTAATGTAASRRAGPSTAVPSSAALVPAIAVPVSEGYVCRPTAVARSAAAAPWPSCGNTPDARLNASSTRLMGSPWCYRLDLPPGCANGAKPSAGTIRVFLAGFAFPHRRGRVRGRPC